MPFSTTPKSQLGLPHSKLTHEDKIRQFQNLNANFISKFIHTYENKVSLALFNYAK